MESDAQERVDSFKMYEDVKITIDWPGKMKFKKSVLVLYALPNGNTTEQTMGKKMKKEDDWHYDIQHIRAQTAFIRPLLKENFIVAYLENNYKSWPSWKQKHKNFREEILHITDTLLSILPGSKKSLQLNGHSGGGSFIFGYLDARSFLPSYLTRISFLDSNYGYDSSYLPKLITWLNNNKEATLTVFAYNDSVALFNGKPVVSPHGGTWYKSHSMLKDMARFQFVQLRNDSLVVYESANRQVAFHLKTNPARQIFHTHQVERNGFIHSILYRTKNENRHYSYFGPRAYDALIKD
jgi:hypothetical protein